MEQQANAGVLEYGSDIARDTYAKDTPGQTPGIDHSPEQHQHKPNLALDGVPEVGGTLKKPNFEKDAGMGKVAEEVEIEEAFTPIGKSGEHDIHHTDTSDYNYKSKHASKVSHGGKGSDEAGEDQFHYKFKDHKIDVNDNQTKTKLSHVQQRVKASGVDPKHHDAVSKSIHKHITAESVEIDEAGRWENTSQGRAYRRLSPEEKARRAKANMLMKRSGAPKSRAKTAKVGIGKLKTVYKGSKLQRNDVMSDLIADLEMAYLGEAMSDSERKQAAAKIFRMHQAKQAAKQANAALGKKSDPAAKAARRDSAGYKTSDDSHLDSKPKAPEKKRGRGERDLPHIVSQLRGVVDTKDGKPSAVKFKDGTTKNVKPKHAAAWLKKHDSAKPQQKLDMYKSHDSHSSFKSYAKEGVEENINEMEGAQKPVRGKDKETLDYSRSVVAQMRAKRLADKKKANVKEEVDQIDELSSKTYKDYIRKAASPVNKSSAVNLASKGAHKLATSDNMDAGEKEDRKAFNRGRGIQRAAKKLYGRTNESNDHLQRMADTWNDHADHKDPKVQKHIKKAEKAYNDNDHDSFFHHTQKAADHAYTLKYKPGVAKPGVTQMDRNRKPTKEDMDNNAQQPQKPKSSAKQKAMKALGVLKMISRGSMTTRKEEKMAGQEYRTQMSKVKSKDPAIRKAISNIYDKKPGKDIDHPEVKAAKKYMKTEAWFDTNSWPTHKDHRKKTADRKTADTLNKPDTLKKRQQMHPAHRKAYDAKVRKSIYDKHGVGNRKVETTPLDKKLHHPDVKAP